MKKIIFLIFFIIILFNIVHVFKSSSFDSVTGASGGSSSSSSGSSGDTSKDNLKNSKNLNAKKMHLTEREKENNKVLLSLIDSCFSEIRSLQESYRHKDIEIESINIYSIIDDNNKIISMLSDKDKSKVSYFLYKIDKKINNINKLLDIDNQGNADLDTIKALINELISLNNQYRIIQWMLYI